MSTTAFKPFQLPNGTVLKNRIFKAAMEEMMADVTIHNQPSPSLIKLYQAFGAGGAGMILSGHVMIDPRAMAAPGDILLAEDGGALDEARWRSWINASQCEGGQFWMQINHPGRQIRAGSGLPVYGPSAVPLKLGSLSKLFDTPVAMTEDHILDVIRRFAWTAAKAEQLGADGVEIHAAHGYLISQFLSPLSNQRTDKWGGSLENRARLLFEVVKAIRASVSPQFGVGIKINTADFQRGGFDAEDLYWVFERLDAMQLDFVEVSGGSAEAPVMISGSPSSTQAREAYFLQAAKKLQEIGTIPIVVTGGIRHLDTLEVVLGASDRFLAGVGTAIGLQPDLPVQWARGEDPAPTVAQSWILPKTLAAVAKTASVQYNMRRTGGGGWIWQRVWPLIALLVAAYNESVQMKLYKNWLKTDGIVAKQL